MKAPSDHGLAVRVSRAGELAGKAASALQTLPVRLHPEWILSLGAGIAQVAQCGAALLNDVLLTSFDLRWPDLSAASDPFETLWLLPRVQVGRLCAARALFACRGALARSIDSGARRRARSLVGEAAFTALLALDPDRRGAAGGALPADDGQTLSLGWSLLRAQCAWRDERLRRLTQLMLPPGAAADAAAVPAAASSSAEHQRFIDGLPHLFPEHTWLFGSEPASLTSA